MCGAANLSLVKAFSPWGTTKFLGLDVDHWSSSRGSIAGRQCLEKGFWLIPHFFKEGNLYFSQPKFIWRICTRGDRILTCEDRRDPFLLWGRGIKKWVWKWFRRPSSGE